MTLRAHWPCASVCMTVPYQGERSTEEQITILYVSVAFFLVKPCHRADAGLVTTYCVTEVTVHCENKVNR